MKKFVIVQVLVLFSHLFFPKTFAQNVGINGTGALPDPSAMLHVDAGPKGFLVTGTPGGGLPDLGAGSRLMFYPGKSAFRSGYIDGTQWDNINVGQYSVAMGFSTTANGIYSSALGRSTFASGTTSTAMGFNTRANGTNSTAMGNSTQAIGINSFAMGNNTIATGNNSTAMGNFTTASGINSTAMGSFVSTNSKTGAFIIGDQFGTGTSSSADNEMTMGFSGGFRLYTNPGATTGAFLPTNGNAWVSVSDVNRKENFEPIDGEDVLQKMSKIEFTSWNYKQQDP